MAAVTIALALLLTLMEAPYRYRVSITAIHRLAPLARSIEQLLRILGLATAQHVMSLELDDLLQCHCLGRVQIALDITVSCGRPLGEALREVKRFHFEHAWRHDLVDESDPQGLG